MPFVPLIPHPSTPCEFIRSHGVAVSKSRAGALQLVYRVTGDIARLNVPAQRPPARTDELWRHTCFELFLRAPDTQAYAEFNFAPSGEWAAYEFDSYRNGMRPIERITPPVITCLQSPQQLQLEVELELPQWQVGDILAAASAVLEETQGRIAYWALAHPGVKPDFHHAAAFALTIRAERS